MKSPVKGRLMRVLLSGEEISELDLAKGVGFSKAATIERWTHSFHNAGFIIRRRKGRSPSFYVQLVRTRQAALKIYHYPEFRDLRPLIRNTPWFSPLFLASFGDLPVDLLALIAEMIRQSHTFFEIICRFDTPAKIRETYQPALILNKLAGISDSLYDDYSVYYQIFVHAVIQDILHGGLGEGFAQLLGRAQETLERHYPEYRDPVNKLVVTPRKRVVNSH